MNLSYNYKSLFDQGLQHKLITHQELVFAACQAVRSVVHLDKTGKAVFAIEAAELWCKEPTTKNANAAAAAVAAYATNAAAYAADAAAASSASAAHYAAYAAAYAADAGYAAAYAAAAANYAAAAAVYVSDSNIDIKKIIMLHLPKLNKLKVFL